MSKGFDSHKLALLETCRMQGIQAYITGQTVCPFFGDYGDAWEEGFDRARSMDRDAACMDADNGN